MLQIKEDDELSHLVCMRCVGTLEYLCDFHEQCHNTQRELLSARERTMTERTFSIENDTDSDKENVLPFKAIVKRKSKSLQSEITKIPKISPIFVDSSAAVTDIVSTVSNIGECEFDQSTVEADSTKVFKSNESMDTIDSLKKTRHTELPSTNENSCESSLRASTPTKATENTQQKDAVVAPCLNEDEGQSKVCNKKEHLFFRQKFTDNNSQSITKRLAKITDPMNAQSEEVKANDQISRIVERCSKDIEGKEKCSDSKKADRRSDASEISASSTSSTGENNNLNDKVEAVELNQNYSTCVSLSTASNAEQIDCVNTEGECISLAQEATTSKAVPVIVKQERSVESETSEQASQIFLPNQVVWMPDTLIIREPEKPKRTEEEKPTNNSPAPGDEAGSDQMQDISSTGSNPECNDIITNECNEREKVDDKQETKDCDNTADQVRKSVIELLQNAKANRSSKRFLETEVDCEDIPLSDRSLLRDLSVSYTTDDGNTGVDFRKRRKITEGKFGKISELISEEQKEAIEAFYRVEMEVVDNERVCQNLTVFDKMNIQCNICTTIYPRMDKCQVHIWGHLNMKPYRCNACDFATVTVSNVRCHIRKSHLKIKPFKCHLCEKKYVTAVLLEEHLNMHTGNKPFCCKLCNFTCSSRQVLSYHKTTHKKVKDVSCPICGKDFYSNGRMRAHIVIHNKDKAFMCKFCSSYLCNEEALERHYQNVHSKDYVCNICGKRTKSRKAMHNHQNVHSAAKYKCPICPNKYKSSHILKEHLLKHEGIRKYKCDTCEKSFGQQSHLAAHKAVHSEKRYACPGCDRRFNRLDNMKMHTKRCEPFLANPELSDLLNKKGRPGPKRKNNSSGTSSRNMGNASDMEKPERDDTLNKMKTEMKLNKTDLDLSGSYSDTGNVNSNTTAAPRSENMQPFESKRDEILRIGEVDIFPVPETTPSDIVHKEEVTVIENELGPECF